MKKQHHAKSWVLRRSCAFFASASVIVSSIGCDAERVSDRTCEPEGQALRWETFGKPFFEMHCQSCHSGVMDSSHSHSVPAGFDFSTLENVQRTSDRIYFRAAGPNKSMPPGPDDPSLGEREKLAKWLACGAPE